MTYTEYAKVISNKLVDDKFNEGKKVRVVNVATKQGKEAIWDRTLDALAHIKPNQTVEVIRGAKGSLTILEREQPRNVNGAGLKSINEVLGGNPNSNGNGATTQQVATSSPKASITSRKSLSLYGLGALVDGKSVHYFRSKDAIKGLLAPRR